MIDSGLIYDYNLFFINFPERYIMNEQPTIIGKTLRLFLYVFFVLLLVMAILPWIVPTSNIGRFLLGVFGVIHFIPANHQNIGDVLNNFNLTTRILGVIGSLISLLPLLISTLVMIKLCNNYSHKNIFSVANANAYSKLGVLYLLSALILQPLSQMLFSFGISLSGMIGPHFIAFGIDISNLTAIFFSVMLIIIGQVVKAGYKIAEEQALTV
jgi:hypothetical protein